MIKRRIIYSLLFSNFIVMGILIGLSNAIPVRINCMKISSNNHTYGELRLCSLDTFPTLPILKKIVIEDKKVFDTPPTFKDGQGSFMKFIASMITYPKSSRTLGTEGIVVVNITISKNGKINNVEIMKGLDNEIDENITSVFKNLDKTTNGFAPGMKDKSPVECSMLIPIKFKLDKYSTIEIKQPKTFIDGEVVPFELTQQIDPENIVSMNVLKPKDNGDPNEGQIHITLKKPFVPKINEVLIVVGNRE
jgi:TonB family protein